MAQIEVSYDKIEEAIAKLDNEIKITEDLFAKQSAAINTLEADSSWNGQAKDGFTSKCKELNGKYESILTHLRGYRNYLQKIVDMYKAMDDVTLSSIENGDNTASN